MGGLFLSRSRTQSFIIAYIQNCSCGQNMCWSKHKNPHILQLSGKSICPNATWFANVSNMNQNPCFLLFLWCSSLTFSSQWRGATFRQSLSCMSWRDIFCLGTYLSGRKMSEIQNVWKAHLSHISINKENGTSVPVMAKAASLSDLGFKLAPHWGMEQFGTELSLTLKITRWSLNLQHIDVTWFGEYLCRCNWFS